MPAAREEVDIVGDEDSLRVKEDDGANDVDRHTFIPLIQTQLQSSRSLSLSDIIHRS